MGLKDTTAPTTTTTYNRDVIEEKVGNIYKAIVIMGKRSEQINSELKNELNKKLDNFGTHNDSLEEVFENREQIEISKYYEKLPKPTLIAIEELLDNDIYYRQPEEEGNN
ncbi:MAG: DNA-directed RNA polymerase subunit omega [Flavobacteriales bacterium]|nr:DNA-directed RNA polymerase subunit omega [Flavobacteriales bacterium]